MISTDISGCVIVQPVLVNQIRRGTPLATDPKHQNLTAHSQRFQSRLSTLLNMDLAAGFQNPQILIRVLFLLCLSLSPHGSLCLHFFLYISRCFAAPCFLSHRDCKQKEKTNKKRKEKFIIFPSFSSAVFSSVLFYSFSNDLSPLSSFTRSILNPLSCSLLCLGAERSVPIC